MIDPTYTQVGGTIKDLVSGNFHTVHRGATTAVFHLGATIGMDTFTK